MVFQGDISPKVNNFLIIKTHNTIYVSSILYLCKIKFVL